VPRSNFTHFIVDGLSQPSHHYDVAVTGPYSSPKLPTDAISTCYINGLPQDYTEFIGVKVPMPDIKSFSDYIPQHSDPSTVSSSLKETPVRA